LDKSIAQKLAGNGKLICFFMAMRPFKPIKLASMKLCKKMEKNHEKILFSCVAKKI